jgi:hypothetical protein
VAAKKKKDKQPKVPSAPTFDQSTLKQPASSDDFYKMLDEMQWRYPQMFEDVLKKQLQYAPALRQADVDYQTALYNNAVQPGLTSAPKYAAAEARWPTSMRQSL